MKIISHRGNITGPNTNLENSPAYVIEAANNNYDVEIDVWLVGEEFYLGHDTPLYQIDKNFLLNKNFWCHAKNLKALHRLMDIGAHCFWHQNDQVTITSKGYIWCYPDTKEFNERSIALCFEKNATIPQTCYGVCTDYPNLLKEKIKQ